MSYRYRMKTWDKVVWSIVGILIVWSILLAGWMILTFDPVVYEQEEQQRLVDLSDYYDLRNKGTMRVLTIIDRHKAHVMLGSSDFFLVGLETGNLVSDSCLEPSLYSDEGTESFITVFGGKRTVRVLHTVSNDTINAYDRTVQRLSEAEERLAKKNNRQVTKTGRNQ